MTRQEVEQAMGAKAAGGNWEERELVVIWTDGFTDFFVEFNEDRVSSVETRETDLPFWEKMRMWLQIQPRECRFPP